MYKNYLIIKNNKEKFIPFNSKLITFFNRYILTFALMKLIKFLFLFLIPAISFSQLRLEKQEIIWGDVISFKTSEGENKLCFSFKDAQYNGDDFLPIWVKEFSLSPNQKVSSVEIIDPVYKDVTISGKVISGEEIIDNSLQLKFDEVVFKKNKKVVIRLIPLIKNQFTGEIQGLTSFRVKITTSQVAESNNSVFKKSFVQNSVLANGDWYKIAVLNNAVYKLDYNFLKQLGLDVNSLNPQEIKIYGSGGGMLPELNSDYRPDDLVQNAIVVQGENDGVFNQNDYILFYGQGPNKWVYNSSLNKFNHELNLYSDTSFYYITVGNTNESPKRIVTQTNNLTSTHTVSTFNDYRYYEKELYNIIKSGQEWYGDQFDLITNYDYSFNFQNIDVSSPVHLKVNGAARHNGLSEFVVSSGNSSFNVNFSSVNTGCYSCIYADAGEDSLSFTVNSDVISVGINYSKPSSSAVAWLNEIELNARRHLIMNGNQMFFRDVNSVGTGNVAGFNLSGAGNVVAVWDVTDAANVNEMSFSGTGIKSFNNYADTIREYVALTQNYSNAVFAKGKVENQNLHGLSQKDMIIVSHPDFLSQAAQIADFHTEKDGLRTVVVTPQQIYNEYSSGSQDVVAIRDFVRMFYERANSPEDLPKYLLLFGDGSYDNKDRIIDNTNFIPTYQSKESLKLVGSLVSDDYYGLLDSEEGTWNSVEYVDIAIGRFPVKSTTEANNVVNKVLNYNTTLTLNDWRNNIVFVGDDEDSNIHMIQANNLTNISENNGEDFNVDKIFFDAYQQVSTPGGDRYPEVNEAILQSFEEGVLIVNYTGHGGETGLAHERVLTVSDINSIINPINLPLFITATCEFSRFDDPKRTSAGELVLLNENGGIGLLSTVRLVYSNPNYQLNISFYNTAFNEVDNRPLTIGEIFMQVKNLNAGSSNNRNFTLLGDPALTLAYPVHDVVTTTFNGQNVSSTLDTVKAFDKVTIEGYLQDKNGQKLTNYNGVIYPTIFDKKKQITTLSNDGFAPFNFALQASKLFKGKASVVNGDFTFSFIVPKDISYNFGEGKISYYAENQEVDANGVFKGFTIGGTSDNYAEDNEGPEIELFMNDDNFVFGGLTDENPSMLAYVEDLHGINMVGNGIGHDIVAVLDDKTDEAFILNDYYEADLNSYQRGTIRFPFNDLTEGRHKLTLKVWDVYNNSREVTTEFVVQKEKDIVIDRVYNYPNPFTTRTEFWFEHNQANKHLYVQVQIFTVSGKLVKTIEKNIYNEGFRSTSIEWDGLDEFGDKLARGVYVYHLRVRAENLSIAEKYQKLVIL